MSMTVDRYGEQKKNNKKEKKQTKYRKMSKYADLAYL